MQEAIQAYNQTAKITQQPRELEAAVLIKAANQLKTVQDNWDKALEQDLLDTALMYNRQLWVVLTSSVVKADNPLPIEIKNNLASLGAFVFKQTLSIQADPKPEKLNALMNVNRELAAGLQTLPS